MLIPEFDLAIHAGQWNDARRIVTQLAGAAEVTRQYFDMSHWQWHRLYLSLQVQADEGAAYLCEYITSIIGSTWRITEIACRTL